MKNKKVILIIRDGWGESDEVYGNAIKAANTPNNDNYIKKYPSTLLKCTGKEVGNPESAQGGSEVGHLTLGAGRIVWQPQETINEAILSGNFFKNEAFLGAIENCKKNNSNLHLAGLFSDAGVHSDTNHLYSLLKLAKENGLENVFIHLILDGRDVPEKSALDHLKKLEEKINQVGVGKVVSVSGRYYGMDRDTNWDRTKAFIDLITKGKGFKSSSTEEAIKNGYDRGDKTDYYVQSTVVSDNNKATTLLKESDSFIWFNFRTDRSRQSIASLQNLDFCPEEYWSSIKPYVVGICRYDRSWNIPVAFEQEKIINNLGEVLSKNGKKQLRVAETEKYAHVTFFFNSQESEKYKNEERIIVNSPKVLSYDLKPEMSAEKVCERILENIGNFDFILINFANADLVGHSGVFEAVVKACEVVDKEVGKIVSKALKNDYLVILGADHGNAEKMLYKDGKTDVSHGFNKIRYIFIGNNMEDFKLEENKGLKDVAPTILEVMGIKKPKEMTGESLIKNEV